MTFFLRIAKRYGTSLVAGLLLASALPPFGWWPLALLGVAIIATRTKEPRFISRFYQNSAVGLGFLGPGLFWMTEFHIFGFMLATAIEIFLFASVLSISRTRSHVKRLSGGATINVWLLITLPASLVLSDALRGAWPFGGVPVALISQTQIGGPLSQFARVGGSLAITALVGIVGVGLGSLMHSRQVLNFKTLIAMSVLIVALFAGGTAPKGKKIRDLEVSIVQGGGERGTRAINTDAQEVVDAHLTASTEIPKGVDLVLWPEDVIEIEGSITDSSTDRGMGALAKRFGAPFAAGIFEIHPDGNRNAAIVWDKAGKQIDRYEKNQRVPFGEYVPFRSMVASLADVSAIPADAIAGKGPGLLTTSAGDIGVVISYEVFFARRARDAMAAGAELIYVPTNATSYSTTQMPALELGAARLRAIETGRFVLQAAPTGFSAFVDPNGNVVSHTNLGDRAVLTDMAQLRTGKTLYTRMGDGPLVTVALIVISWPLVIRKRKIGGDQELWA